MVPVALIYDKENAKESTQRKNKRKSQSPTLSGDSCRAGTDYFILKFKI